MKSGAGLLRECLRFERRSEIDNEAGTYVGEFEAQFTTHARIRPLNGREEVLAARLQGTVVYEITIRCSAQTKRLTPEWRAVNTRANEAYNIRSIVNPDEHNAYLILIAEKSAVDG